MIPGMQQQFLAWLKVPPEPTPPAGSPGSLRVFRAGRNYLRLQDMKDQHGHSIGSAPFNQKDQS